MEVAIIEYPGASAARETAYAYETILGAQVRIVWHDEETFGEPDLLVLPGGASFCDYLRPGALARSSRISASVRRFSREGRVLGIGNGFQILCELGILPGALIRNSDLQFVNQEVYVRVGNTSCALAQGLEGGKVFRMPIACAYGCYYADQRSLNDMEDKGLVVLRYCDDAGVVSQEACPTGSLNAIAGISNFKGNVLGLTVRPERCVERLMGNDAGIEVLRASLGASA